MKFSIDQKQFLTLVSAATKASGGLRDATCSSHVKMMASAESIECVGTNMETMIIANTNAAGKIEEPGEVLLPGKLIVEILTALGGLTDEDDQEMISVRTADNMLYLKTPRTKHYLLVMPADDFPPVPVLNKDPKECLFARFTINRSDLVRLLDHVVIAAGERIAGASPAGVALWFDGECLFAAATDSHRLAVHGIPVPGLPATSNDKFILPVKAVQEIIKVASNCQEERILVFSDRAQIGFATPTVTVLTRLLEGKFPNLSRVLVNNPTRTVTFAAKDMLQALKVVKSISVSANSMVTLSFPPGQCKVSAEAQEQGSAESTFPVAEGVGPDGFQISMNFKYVEAVMNVMKGSAVQLSCTTSSYPGEFGLAGTGLTEAHRYRHVIMPMTF